MSATEMSYELLTLPVQRTEGTSAVSPVSKLWNAFWKAEFTELLDELQAKY